MPRKQLEKVIVAELGPEWRAKLADFDFEPLAAASIGQVRAQPVPGRGSYTLLDFYPCRLDTGYCIRLVQKRA